MIATVKPECHSQLQLLTLEWVYSAGPTERPTGPRASTGAQPGIDLGCHWHHYRQSAGMQSVSRPARPQVTARVGQTAQTPLRHWQCRLWHLNTGTAITVVRRGPAGARHDATAVAVTDRLGVPVTYCNLLPVAQCMVAQ
jgi:hypothetical protein